MDPDFKSVRRSNGSDKTKIDRQPETKTSYDTSFLTPEEVAAADNILGPVKLDDMPNIEQAPIRGIPDMKKPSRHFWRPSKKNLAIISIFIVMAGVGTVVVMNRQA